MKIHYTLDTKTAPMHGVTLRLTYYEFVKMVELIGANPPNDAIEAEIIGELESAHEIIRPACNAAVEIENEWRNS